MASLLPPVPQDEDLNGPVWQLFLEELRNQINGQSYYAASIDPNATQVPAGTYSAWLNTTSGVLKIWANQGGVLKSTTLT